MAIDLRTGPIGKKVYAARDGEVTRVRCSPWGYGKAVYVRFDDGNTAVYAHLDGFEEPIASYVRNAQHAKKDYTVDLYPGAGELRVNRGQLIAFSGQTGVGVPHLHYEIRDASNRPIDPRTVGIDWPDTTRPVIRKIVVAPKSPDDLVNGDILPVILDARPVSPGVYTTNSVRVFGEVGFGVDVIDPANEGASKLGIQDLRAANGDTPIFHVRHEVISYDTNGGGAVAYHPQLKGDGRFLLAWAWPGNRLESYRGNDSDGWFSPGNEATTITLSVVDFHGNSAEVNIPIEPDAPEADLPMDGSESEGLGDVELDVLGESLIITADFPAAEGTAPVLEIEGTAAKSGGNFFRVGSGRFRAGYVASSSGTVTLRVTHPRLSNWERRLEAFTSNNRARTVHFGDVRLDVPANVGYGTIYLRAYELSESPAARPATPSGKIYMVWPSDAPLQHDITVSIPRPADMPSGGAHVYRLRGSYWSAMSTDAGSGSYSVSASSLGGFQVMVDRNAPRIFEVSPAEGAVLTDATPRIRAKVSDQGAGIAGMTVTAGGQWLLCEWDPETGWLSWEQDRNLSAGNQDIIFTVTDRAGNTTVERRSITIQ